MMKSTIISFKIGFLFSILISVGTTHAQNLFFQRVFDETLAQASYVIADKNTGEAIVIDPKRDIDTYVQIAKENNLIINKVTETHIHADYLSGARELAQVTGAELLLSGEGGADWQYMFAHKPLMDGDVIRVGSLVLEVMHTPGHTPESITFLLMDKTRKMPVKAVTGDFIFVGDVGRPDLLEKAAGYIGTQEKGAKDLFASVQKFLRFHDDLEIWPGHGAGSFCGKSLSNIPQSTLGQERLTNPALQFGRDEAAFVRYILDGQPDPPKYFAMMKHLNKTPRPLMIMVPKHPILTAQEYHKARAKNLLIIDARTLNDHLAGYEAGSLQLNGGKSFSTWAGSMIDYSQQLVIIADRGREEELTRTLMRIGMDNIYGFVNDPSILQLQKPDLLSLKEFKSYLGRKDVEIIDVRSETEYKAGHIKGVKHIPYPDLAGYMTRMDKNKEIVVHCQSGVRSVIAYSMLKANGFKKIRNFAGGVNEWTAGNNEVMIP